MDSVFNGSLISLLKFPGAAFMLCDKAVDDNFIDLFDFTSNDIEDDIEIKIMLNTIYSKCGEARITEWPLINTDKRIFVLPDRVHSMLLFSTFMDV